jgi:hypothetical protein
MWIWIIVTAFVFFNLGVLAMAAFYAGKDRE